MTGIPARTMRRMARVSGRTADMLIIRGVNVFPSQIEAEILKIPGLSAHYQLEVGRDANLATLLVRVERAEDFDPDHDQASAEALAIKIKGNVGVTADIDVCDRGAVPRSAGKAQRVIRATP